MLKHCKSFRRMKEIPALHRFISEGSHIDCPIRTSAGEALSKGFYLWRMQEHAAYRVIPGIHYERMVADDDAAYDPDGPPASST